MTTLQINKHMITQYFIDDTGCEKNIFIQIVGDYQAVITTSPNDLTQSIKKVYLPLEKWTTAMWMLVYGVASDAVGESKGDTRSLECLHWLCKVIIQLYDQKYLIALTQDDLQRILFVSKIWGFSGMIGNIDRIPWKWKNCPMACEDQFTRRNKEPSLLYLKQLHLMLYGFSMYFPYVRVH